MWQKEIKTYPTRDDALFRESDDIHSITLGGLGFRVPNTRTNGFP